MPDPHQSEWTYRACDDAASTLLLRLGYGRRTWQGTESVDYANASDSIHFLPRHERFWKHLTAVNNRGLVGNAGSFIGHKEQHSVPVRGVRSQRALYREWPSPFISHKT